MADSHLNVPGRDQLLVQKHRACKDRASQSEVRVTSSPARTSKTALSKKLPTDFAGLRVSSIPVHGQMAGAEQLNLASRPLNRPVLANPVEGRNSCGSPRASNDDPATGHHSGARGIRAAVYIEDIDSAEGGQLHMHLGA